MELVKTIRAKIVHLTRIKEEALIKECENYQKAIRISENLIEELEIKSVKQATDLLYKKESKYALRHFVPLYSATYQTAYTKALYARRGKFKKEQPLRLRNDTFDIKRIDNKIAIYWAKIPVYDKRGGIKVAIRMSPKHEELLQDPEICLCDSELLKKNGDFYLHITVKKYVDITPKRSSKLAVIGIDTGIRNTAVSVVWRDDRITGVTMHSGGKLKHKVQCTKEKLAKFHRHAFKHNEYHYIEKTLDKETEIGQKLSNYTKDCLHKISSEIVEKAVELRAQGYEVLIACEDLEGIRGKISGRLHWWAFRKLLEFVKYKAAWDGIPCVKVQPANTSKICPRCGNYNRSNRKDLDFICTECKYNANADLVGAANVATRSLGFLELYAQGNGRCESAQEVVSAEPQAVKLG